MGEVRLEHKHPRAIRWFHWINFPVLTLMIWSGLLIYWAHDVYRVGIGSWTVFHFFPNWFYDTLTVSGRLAEGMAWHFLLMWLFLINGLLYVAYTAISGFGYVVDGIGQLHAKGHGDPNPWSEI